MFEKEAEEWVKTKGTDAITCLKECIGWDDVCEQAFKDGACFGYNKANEWYYPSKGEYPKDGTNVLVIYYTRFNSDTKQPLGELQCKIAGHLGRKWYSIDTGCGNKDYWLNKPDMVYAWKEIELPKEVNK